MMTQMVLPQHSNALGAVFGGTLVSWIDIAAAIAAQRHTGRPCVTASIDEMHFLRPIRVGHVVNICARLTSVNHSSCEVLVTVEGENNFQNEQFHIAQAFLTFVALDDLGRPMKMPQLLALTSEEKKLQSQAGLRREHRLRLKAMLANPESSKETSSSRK